MKKVMLVPKTASPPPGVQWASGRCSLCGKSHSPVVLDIAPNPKDRDIGEDEGGVYVCPDCAERIVGLVLTAFEGFRAPLAAVAHDIWSYQMKNDVMPGLEKLAANHLSSLNARDQSDPWTQKLLDALRREELAINGWKALMLVGFADLLRVQQVGYLMQADKMLAALGARIEPVEQEFVGVDHPVFTSARLRTEGVHDKVRIWNRGGLAGELVLNKGDGEKMLHRLGMVNRADSENFLERIAGSNASGPKEGDGDE